MLALNGILAPSGGGGGAGDVVGPASSTDNAICRFDSTTGKLLQNSAVFVGDDSVVRIGSNNSNNYGALRDSGDSSGTVDIVKAANPVSVWGNLNTTQGRISAAYLSNSKSSSTSTVTISGSANALQLSNIGTVVWTNNSSSEVAPLDLGIARNSAGVARISNGSSGIGALLTARSVEANTDGSGTPNALTATESWKVLTNEGATAANYHTLPTAVAGYVFTFVVQDTDGIRITANTDDTIRVIDKVTASAGYIESTTIGSGVTLIAINATEWVAHPIHGVWTDGTFTYDDTGLTSP